jgi:hypothetical protein
MRSFEVLGGAWEARKLRRPYSLCGRRVRPFAPRRGAVLKSPRPSEGDGAPSGASIQFMSRIVSDACRLSARHRGVLLPAPGRAFRGRSRLASSSSAPVRLIALSRFRAEASLDRLCRQPSSWQAPLVVPGGAPAPPECRFAKPARGRRVADVGFTRYRPSQGGSAITTPHESALERTGRCGV